MSDDRSVKDVLENHLDCRQTGDLEGDLERNYAPDVVLMTMEGVFRGHDGVRENAERLRYYFPQARFSFPEKKVADRFAFIEWRAEHEDAETRDGSDTFVIENGRIVCQTIRYTVHSSSGDRMADAAAEEQWREQPPPAELAPDAEDAVRVIRHPGGAEPRYAVEFIGERGQSITVECIGRADGQSVDLRADAIRAAREALDTILHGSDSPTFASSGHGLRSTPHPSQSDAHSTTSAGGRRGPGSEEGYVAGEQVDINSAPASVLARLPRLGALQAESLVRARPFAGWDEVEKLEGFDREQVAAMRRAGALIRTL